MSKHESVAGGVCIIRYDTGLQVIGVIEEILRDSLGRPVYLRTRGPTRLAFGDLEIDGHGADYHREGFGSPVGHLKGFSRCLSSYAPEELEARGLVTGESVSLEFLSGITVTGRLSQVLRPGELNLIFSFEDCTVKDSNSGTLFEPAWGTYDMAVGSAIEYQPG